VTWLISPLLDFLSELFNLGWEFQTSPIEDTMTSDTLQRLAATVRARRTEAAGKSYTRQLLDAGPERCARKFGEEAIETVIAGLGQDDDALMQEAADLLFHLIVLLESRNIDFESVVKVLESREGVSGLAEKAARGS